ncbi:hypothetical protein GCM10022226_41620 [Sphaerisporangium flaviroseum]|uniref:Phosphatidic acid phosphatase type 2/haloperoxidase domain-containing protein n=1 Tax=Sphaerisporangium flaviroseum TaxID=509199 RepID=A0ABP7IEQ4_9ACTN
MVRSDVRFGVRAALSAGALALVAVPFGLLLLLVKDRWPPLEALDASARDDLNQYAVQQPGFVAVMKALSAIGSSAVYLVVFAVVAAWLWRRGLPRLALFVVVTTLGGWLLNVTVKEVVDRARPVVTDPVASAQGLSFPSGHAQAAMVAYGVLLLSFWPALRGVGRRVAVVVAVLLVIGIGFSRVALGVHFVSDVLAGYALGAAWVLAMTAAFSAWRVERGRPAVDPTEGLEPEQAARLSGDAGTHRPDQGDE